MVKNRPAVQETLEKSPVAKASILLLSAFFTVQLSHPYLTTGKILEGEVNFALGSITKNKASGSDGIPVELF